MERTYRSWAAMKQRCANPKASNFARYGAKGISFDVSWSSFPAFLSDMGVRPPGTSLDRWPNKTGNYEPGNCRWATPQEQRANTTRTAGAQIEFNGETKTVREWERATGLSNKTIFARFFSMGWSAEETLTTPALRGMTRTAVRFRTVLVAIARGVSHDADSLRQIAAQAINTRSPD